MVSRFQAVNRALLAWAPSSVGEARSALFGGSTKRTAAAMGVTERSVQRYVAAEEGRGSQKRRSDLAGLGRATRREALRRIQAGGASYTFAGAISTASGRRRGSSTRNTQGLVAMDSAGARAWAAAELRGDNDAADDLLSEALFGEAGGYPIPTAYAYVKTVQAFSLSLG